VIHDQDTFSLSQIDATGVLDPVVVEQYGYSGTGTQFARTDAKTNTAESIPIDNATGWVGSRAQMSLWDMKRLYAQNATFDDGVEGVNVWPDSTSYYPYGWDVSWDDTSSGAQNLLTEYDETEGYVAIEIQGEEDTSSGYILYNHYAETYAYWAQTVNNVPYSNNLTLDFQYMLDSGIIDALPWDIDGFVWLEVWVDTDNVAYLDLLDESNNPSRDVWYDFPSVSIIDAPSQFDLEIGLYIDVTGPPYPDYYQANPGADYDEDGYSDFDNARVTRVLLDNISLIAETQPSFESVDLRFTAGDLNVSIGEASGFGTATIENPSLWTTGSLPVGITSNVSISCHYEIDLLSHNYGDSLWTPQPGNTGVEYSISSGTSASLASFSYIGSDGVSMYENFTVAVYTPSDWENVTVFDPFLNDVTSQCTVSVGQTLIPTSILDRLGWWQFQFESPNYALDIRAQILDGGSWFDSSLYRSGNITRASVIIGTLTEAPMLDDAVNVTWYQPDESVWSQASVTSLTSSVANTTQRTLVGSTTVAGEWTVTAVWTNGTEVALGATVFSLYHAASLEVPTGYETVETDSGLTISNFVYLTDADTGDYLLEDSATVTANWSTSTVVFTQDLVKNWWRAEFDTSLIGGGEFTVVVTANLPYFDPVTTQFTIITTMETRLEVANAGAVPVEKGLNEVFTARIEYELLNGSPIVGASIDVSHSGPGGGLTWNSFIDYANGTYSVDLVCGISDTYPITITLSKSYHYDASDTFTLIIGETGTSFTLLNGTADVLVFGGEYNLVVEYRNSTGHLLSGATIEVISSTPAVGLSYTAFSPLSVGVYNATLTPLVAGSFSVVIQASLPNHEIRYATFTITASGIPTVLTALPSTATISVDQTFTVQLWFQEEDLDSIDTALFTAVNPPSGVSISSFTWVGNGLYNVTLTPLSVGSFDLLFRASADNYQSSSAAFALIATEIQTALTFGGDVSSDSASFAEPYNLTVYFTRADTGAFVADANITVVLSDPHAVSYLCHDMENRYVLTITGRKLGAFSLTVIANKTDHRVSVKQFLLEVLEIETFVDGLGPLDALLVGREYDFLFSFCFESNSSCIDGADITLSGSGAAWVTVQQLPTGNYSVTLTPAELGDHSVLLQFEKTGFSSASFRLSFRVERVPLNIIVNQGLSGLEQMSTSLVVTILEADTSDPVSGLSVSYQILRDGLPVGDPVAMEETPTAGIYSALMTMPEMGGSYSVEVIVFGDYHSYSGDFVRALVPERTLGTMILVTVTRYSFAFIGIGAIAIGLMARRRYRKKRIRENKIAMAVKKRFDGIKSLLGVIVLHKESGLPIYSRILREGLDETVISAFITAVTSFRKEFDIEDSSEEWSLIPISDIVRVVATDKLVCAFITVGRPSEDYRERMIRFAKTVGFIFDEPLSDIPIVVIDHHNKVQFDSLFDDILDGALLRTYKLADDKPYKPKSCADERIAKRTGETFKLEELASDIASCGLEEGRVYKAIMEALENHLLVSADEPSPYTSQLALPVEPLKEDA
jgi:hypothetical protein